jgi:OmpA-OmpF porin, OOP family
MSILNSLKGMVTDQLVSGLSSHLGESPEGVTKAMGGIFPTLLGSLMGSKQEDHSMLSGILSQAGNHDDGGNMASSLLGGLTGGNASSGLAGMGGSLVSGLLGNKSSLVSGLISNMSGISSGSTSSLMGIGGSLVASFLGKQMLSSGGGIGSIMSMLGGHKDEIMAAAPAGLGSALGLEGLFGGAKETVSNAVNNVTGAASNAASNVGNAVEEVAGGGMKWLWPLLLLAALAVGLWYFMQKGCNKTETPTGAVVDSTVGAVAATVDTTVKAAVAGALESIKVKLADGTMIDANKGSLEDKLVAFINDPTTKGGKEAGNWFNFNNLTFETAKSTLKPGGEAQIKNIAAILKAYPKLQIKIGGYTDNVGDSTKNVVLSNDRAKTVYNAIVAAGASNKAQFVENAYEGYGSQFPVGDNATEEGKAQNRRISVCVRAK